MILSEDSVEKSKKKRGRPKSTKNKTETKKPKTEAAKKKESTTVSVSKAVKAAALAEKAAKAAAKAEEAKLKAEAEHQTAVKLATSPEEAGEVLSNKRNQERIFRREMGEPEFFRNKKELAPLRPILSDAEGQTISRKVQIPINNIPQYAPEHILSPEYAGLSNYELGISTVQEETEEKLAALRNDPNANPMSIEKAEDDLQLIENMVNNYSLTTNVFRTAKGGRDKLKR